MRWAGRRLVVGVSGGIAVYKSCILVRRLVEAGAEVEVVMTRGATRFVRPVTFEALTGRPVRRSLWRRGAALDHVRLAADADLVVVAPATAHLIARAALGIADDLLTALLLARTGPVLLAPAMNDMMYAAEPVARNLAALRARGWTQVGPATGPLAEGDSDLPGRMAEPEVIVRHAARVLRGGGALAGRRVLVTAGPTREPIDPVRVLTNRSSGRMGFRVAEAAWERGAEVTLVTGPSAEAPFEGLQVVRVDTTAELHAAVATHLPAADLLVMAAAPADWRVAEPRETKHARADGPVALALTPTADILSETRASRKPGAVIVGFALETGDPSARAREKLERKGLDLVVANDALEPGAGFEVATNRVTLLGRDGPATALPLMPKADVAEAILDAAEALLVRRQTPVPPPPA